MERVFVNLEAVYPVPNNPNEEMSFEELRAASRGWMGKDWAAGREQLRVVQSQAQAQGLTLDAEADDVLNGDLADQLQHDLVIDNDQVTHPETAVSKGGSREGRSGRPKKMRVMEVKGETQTSRCPLPKESTYS